MVVKEVNSTKKQYFYIFVEQKHLLLGMIFPSFEQTSRHNCIACIQDNISSSEVILLLKLFTWPGKNARKCNEFVYLVKFWGRHSPVAAI